MVSEALRVDEITEGEDPREKTESTHPSLLSQNKGVVIDVFICKLHKSVDLPFTHKSAYISRLNSVGYSPGNPEWCLMKGMMAAELAELSLCVTPSSPPSSCVFVSIYHGSAWNFRCRNKEFYFFKKGVGGSLA